MTDAVNNLAGGIHGKYLVWNELVLIGLIYVVASTAEAIIKFILENTLLAAQSMQSRTRSKIAWHYFMILVGAVIFSFMFALITTQGEKNESYLWFKQGTTLSGTEGQLGEPFR